MVAIVQPETKGKVLGAAIGAPGRIVIVAVSLAELGGVWSRGEALYEDV